MTDDVAPAFAFQAGMCRQMGSELTARLLERAHEDLAVGGIVARLCEGWTARDAVLGALPLRLLAVAHRRALAGEAPALARHLPTLGGTPRYPEVGDLFLAELARGDPGAQLGRFPQTNEIGRAAALLGAFLAVAARTGCDLELLEIGASAGLNRHWPRFRYELGDWSWGDPDSPTLVRADWTGGRPLGPDVGALRVRSSRGCDLSPIDVGDEAEALRLCSYVWADQVERLERLRGAIALARREPTLPERARAGEWLAARLEAPREPGTARIVYHSAVWLYLPETEQRAVREAIAAAGARADTRTPLAWVLLEHEDADHTLRLTTWPGGAEERLATASPHGLWVRWEGPTA